MTDNITYLRDWKAKKRQEQNQELPTRPLYVNHQNGNITGSPHNTDPEVGARLARVRASLERINKLMAELKKMSTERNIDENTKNNR